MHRRYRKVVAGPVSFPIECGQWGRRKRDVASVWPLGNLEERGEACLFSLQLFLLLYLFLIFSRCVEFSVSFQCLIFFINGVRNHTFVHIHYFLSLQAKSKFIPQISDGIMTKFSPHILKISTQKQHNHKSRTSRSKATNYWLTEGPGVTSQS